MGTVQLEFFKLAQLTGRADFYDKAAAVFKVLDEQHTRTPPLGTANGGRLWPLYISPKDGSLVGTSVSWGAMGDSFYEYTLKASGITVAAAATACLGVLLSHCFWSCMPSLRFFFIHTTAACLPLARVPLSRAPWPFLVLTLSFLSRTTHRQAYLLVGRKTPAYRQMYRDAIQGMRDVLLATSPKDGHVYARG